jgi:hypothetical protein
MEGVLLVVTVVVVVVTFGLLGGLSKIMEKEKSQRGRS